MIGDILLKILLGILPAAILVIFIYFRDKYQHEPIKQILKGVLYGILVSIVIFPIEIVLGLALSSPLLTGATTYTVAEAFSSGFIVAAIPEESIKLLFLWLLLHRNKYFDENVDGIVYAVCIGMGFAAIENVLYLFSPNEYGLGTTAILRALFATPMHYMCAVVMGYFYSKTHFTECKWWVKASVIIAPVLIHGIYDSLVFTAMGLVDDYLFLASAILALLLAFFIWVQVIAERSLRKQLALDKERIENEQLAQQAVAQLEEGNCSTEQSEVEETEL